MPEPVEFRWQKHFAKFDEGGVVVDDRFLPWNEVGAFGILERAGFRSGAGRLRMPLPGIPHGCLAVCLLRDVDPVPAFAVDLECSGSAPSAAETAQATELLERELGELWDRVPLFAPAGRAVGAWWRSQVYGPGSAARTDAERVSELRSELKQMRDDLAGPSA